MAELQFTTPKTSELLPPLRKSTSLNTSRPAVIVLLKDNVLPSVKGFALLFNAERWQVKEVHLFLIDQIEGLYFGFIQLMLRFLR